MGEDRWPTRRQLGWIAGASVAISTAVAVWLVFALREPFSRVTETMDVTTGEAVQISTDAGYTYPPPAQVTASAVLAGLLFLILTTLWLSRARILASVRNRLRSGQPEALDEASQALLTDAAVEHLHH
jgi:putative effector of murein hydrolase